MADQFDLVIRNGKVADGRGGALWDGDIAVLDGKIAAIGTFDGRGHAEIDATGRLVTPGFVDIHTHYDGQATWDARLNPSSWHGVTTVVMGNCGVGFAPVRTCDHTRLIELMEGVEDIPGAALHAGLKWNWESFGEYLDAVERTPHDIDIAAQLPHGALRVYVMGERGANLEPATDEDIRQMRRIAADAMRVGALGFSTSRTLNHKTAKGDPTPSLRATEAELHGIAMGLSDAGSGVIELISDFPDLEQEFGMVRRLVEASGRPLTLSLAQGHGGSAQGWRKILSLIEKSSAEGLPIKAQVAPRPIGVLLGLQGTINPFIAHAAFQPLKDKPLAEKVRAMRDPMIRAKILDESAERGKAHPLARGIMAFDRMFALGDPPNYEPPKQSSIAAIAARSNRAAAEIAYDFLLQDEGRSFLFAPFANYAEFNLDHCGEMIAHKDCVMGLGDGGAHVGIISDASFATYLLTHWGRDRGKGMFDVSYLVKRQTSDTARAVGLNDRGVIAPGLKADLNIIDMDKLAVEAPSMAYDLPAGGKRLLQGAKGYDATIVSGQVIYRHGEASDALPGKLVRGPQA